MADRRKVELNKSLEAHEDCPLSARVPEPIAVRLDQLRDLLDDQGLGRVHLKEVLAAVILAASADIETLKQQVQNYRDAKGRDAVLDAEQGAEIIEFAKHKSGSRPRAL